MTSLYDIIDQKESSTEKNIIVMFTDPDPGEEIDDEILIHLLMKSENTNTYVYIVCVPGITEFYSYNEELILIKMNDRIQKVKDIFPDKFSNNLIWQSTPHNINSSLFILCTFKDFCENLSSTFYGKFKINTLLHVAPLWHINPKTLNSLEIDTRIFMGDLKNPNTSVNALKRVPYGKEGEILRNNFLEQEKIFEKICKKTIYIPITFARQIKTPINFIKTLPKTLASSILETAFKYFVNRPNPNYQWAENMSIINHENIMKMLPSDVLYDIILNNGNLTFKKEDNCPNFSQQVLDYLKKSKKSQKPSINDLKKYINRLEHLAMAVKYITKVNYDGNGFNEDSLTDKNTAKINWINYVIDNQCSLTPFYDGLAWIVMKEGKLPDLDKCKDIIKNLSTI
jgi:hypothetical protein